MAKVGNRESTLSQVAAGAKLSGAQGRPRLINSYGAPTIARPGRAVQIEGGSGANCAKGTAKIAAQNNRE
jgi:hypothetical protein